MRAIVTVIGKDHVGIIADVTALLAQYGVNVLDISQTVLQEYFTMIMLVDASQCTVPFADLARALDEAGATLTHILLTHGHYDHVGSAGVLSREWKARIYCEPADCRGSQLFPMKSADSGYQEGEKLTVDELTFTVWHTPGHTEGGVVLLCGDYLFVGDTVFQGSIGRTDLEGGSMQKMDASLRKLAGLPIPKETQLLPGHGDFSTLGEELANNFYIRSALRGGNADF